MEHSNVIETYKARVDEDNSAIQNSAQKHSAFLKKRNRPHLQLDLLDSEKSQQSGVGSIQNSQVTPFQPRLINPYTAPPITHLSPPAHATPHYEGER